MTLALPQEDNRQLLPVADAFRAVGLTNDTSFYNWCKKWRVSNFRQGRYRRQDLIDGLAREEAAAIVKAKRRARK